MLLLPEDICYIIYENWKISSKVASDFVESTPVDKLLSSDEVLPKSNIIYPGKIKNPKIRAPCIFSRMMIEGQRSLNQLTMV